MNPKVTKKQLVSYLPLVVALILFFMIVHPFSSSAQSPDPSGTHTGTIKDVPAAKPGALPPLTKLRMLLGTPGLP
jgi:hypothetical protein